MDENLSVNKLIHAELIAFDDEIDAAIKSRKKSQTTKNGLAFDEDIRKAEAAYRAEKQIDDPELMVLTLPKFEKSDNEVVTTDSHLYPILLKKSIEKGFVDPTLVNVPENADRFEKWVRKLLLKIQMTLNQLQVNYTVRTISEHEFDHAVTVLGDPNIKVTYGVGFYEGGKPGITLVKPFITLEGTLSKAQLDIVRSHPKRLSPKDKAVLTGNAD